MNAFARLLVIAATTAGAAGLLLLFGGQTQSVTVLSLSATPPPAGTPASTPAVSGSALAPSALIPEATDTDAPAPPPLEISTTMPAWEHQLETLTGNPPKRDAATARAIFAMLPALPEEAIATVTERAVDALPDADYAAVALPVVTNPRTHNRAMSVLFSDLMERPDAIALPALLQIARSPGHSFAPSAKDNLQLLLKEDFGDDWTRWDAEVQRALARERR